MTDQALEPDMSAAGRYNSLATDRDVYLDRARENSLYTIPSLIPPLGFGATSKLYQPYQSIGARGLNNLASKLLLTLLPPNSPFFKMLADPAVADKLSNDPKFKDEVDKALSLYERIVMTDIEGSQDRVALFEVLKHLLVAGNILVNLPKAGMRVFHLDKYVVKRDPQGTPLEMVVKECIAIVALSEEIKALVSADQSRSSKTVDVFTHVIRKSNQWIEYQEVCGKKVPGSYGQYPLDKSPWLPLRLIRIDGEDYGRAYCEEYIGDLKSLEGLSKAIVEAAAAASKVLFLVKPNSTTSASVIEKAPNLAIRQGNAEDVTVLQVLKGADLQVASSLAEKIEQRLSYAFLMQSAVQRQAERVTAEEIRYMAGELEQALGGVYGILSQEFQLPYLNRKIAVLNKAGKLPRLPKGLVKVSIVTGIEALGRGNDRNKLVQFITTIGQALGPQAINTYVNMSDLIERLAAADGIDTDGLIKPQQQVDQEAQQAQQMQLAQKVGPQAVSQIGGIAKDYMNNAQTGQPAGNNPGGQ